MSHAGRGVRRDQTLRKLRGKSPRWLYRLVRLFLVWAPMNVRLRGETCSSYLNAEARQQAYNFQGPRMPDEVGGRCRSVSVGTGFRPGVRTRSNFDAFICRTEQASGSALVCCNAIVGKSYFVIHDSILSLPETGSAPNVKDEPRWELA